MNRRVFLATSLGAVAASLAGCIASLPRTPLSPEPFPPDPTLRWVCQYRENLAHLEFDALVGTTDGGYLAAGTRMNGTDGRLSAYLVRTDGAGEERWRRTVDGAGAIAAVEASDGGFVVLRGAENPSVLRVDADGEPMWTRELSVDSRRTVVVSDIAADADGYVITGSRTDRHGESSSADERWTGLVIALDIDGQERWARTFPIPVVHTVVPLEDGSLLLCATEDGVPDVRWLDTDGEERQHRIYSHVDNDALWTLSPTPSGFVFAGRSVDPELAREVPWMLAIDADGEVLWSYSYQFGGAESYTTANFADLAVDADGSIYVTGAYHPTGHWDGRTRPILAKVSRDGSRVEWVRQYGAVSGGGFAVVRSVDDSTVVAGELTGAWTEGFLLDAGRPTESNIPDVVPVRRRWG